jgi:hypothetical protein
MDSGDTSDTSTDTSGTDSEDTSTDTSGTDSDSEPPPDCEVVGCENPPEDTCDDEGNLLVYSGSSTCLDHVCQYEFSIELCHYGCVTPEGELSRCKTDACDGVVCLSPPSECKTEEAHPGWLYVDSVMWCNLDTGLCEEDSRNEIYCGDREGCISVSGAPDYCDYSVFTPCESDDDCSGSVPSTCEETSEGFFRTHYFDGTCDLTGDLTGTVGKCSYQTEITDVTMTGC